MLLAITKAAAQVNPYQNLWAVAGWSYDPAPDSLVEQIRWVDPDQPPVSIMLWKALGKEGHVHVLQPVGHHVVPDPSCDCLKVMPTDDKPYVQVDDWFRFFDGDAPTYDYIPCKTCEEKEEHLGLGDVIEKVTKAFGIKPCEPCKQRKRTLNKLFPKVMKRR